MKINVVVSLGLMKYLTEGATRFASVPNYGYVVVSHDGRGGFRYAYMGNLYRHRIEAIEAAQLQGLNEVDVVYPICYGEGPLLMMNLDTPKLTIKEAIERQLHLVVENIRERRDSLSILV